MVIRFVRAVPALAVAAALLVGSGAAVSVGAPVDAPADPLAPVLPGSTPALPADGLPLGDAAIIVDGVAESTFPSAFYKYVWVMGPGGGISFMTFSPDGRQMVLSPGQETKSLTVPPGGSVRGNVPGMRQESTLAFYLLGSTTVRQDSTSGGGDEGHAVFEVPADYPTGPAVLQLNGVTEEGQSLSISFGVLVAKVQSAVNAPTLPRRLRDEGWTRLMREPIRTNAGQRVQVRVTCLADKDIFGKPKRCRTDRDDGGWTRVWMSGQEAMTVWVVQRAPAVDGYAAYLTKKKYSTRAAR